MAKNKVFFSKVGAVRTYLTKHWKRTLLIIVVLVAAFFIYKKVTAEPAGITSTKVTQGTLVNSFSANGKIKAKKEVNLKFITSGKVVWVGVKRGDTVAAWRGVASLDTIPLNSTYMQALNTYRNLQAQAESVLDSVKDHASDETFAQKATRTAAESARDSAYDAVRAAQDNLKNAVLVTPIAGTVVDTNGLLAGSTLSGGDLETKFIRIVDLGSLYFDAKVDEVDFSKVKLGQEAVVNVDAYPGKSCKGKVSFVGRDGQESTGGVVTIPVEVAIDGCSLDLASGLNGQVNLTISKLENVLIIPKKYLVNKNGEDFVWLQTGKTTKERKLVAIKIGSTTSTEVEVQEGLSSADTIIFVP